MCDMVCTCVHLYEYILLITRLEDPKVWMYMLALVDASSIVPSSALIPDDLKNHPSALPSLHTSVSGSLQAQWVHRGPV